MTRRKNLRKNITQKKYKTDDKPKLSHLQVLFTVVSIIIAFLGLFFTYINYKKSLPQMRLDDWTIEIVEPYKESFSSVLLISADISNLGGSPVALTKSNLELTYGYSSSTAVSNTIQTATSEADTTTITTAGYKIVFVIPSTTTDPEEVMCMLQETGLLEFPDIGTSTPPPSPTENKYTMNDKYVCFGVGDCKAIPDDIQPAVLVFSGDKEKIIINLISKQMTFDDKPISITQGETKRIFMAWYIPYSCDKKRVLEQFVINLGFNNHQVIPIDVMKKLYVNPR
jgi:hypothetical protein